MDNREKSNHGKDNGYKVVIVLCNGSEQVAIGMTSCLVGKLWMDKSFNIRESMNMIREVWNL